MKLVTVRCPEGHHEVGILPSGTAWCRCGRAMEPATAADRRQVARARKRLRRSGPGRNTDSRRNPRLLRVALSRKA
ncbi:MAG TPA: hypothetical protein VFL31_07510 [Nitrospiraceae bacterium]|nr:hypothetical protein [Nitrospiraceae bacterium]